MKRHIIKDGSQWPDPDGTDLEWLARHDPAGLSKADFLCIAEIIGAYSYLLHGDCDFRSKLTMLRMAIR